MQKSDFNIRSSYKSYKEEVKNPVDQKLFVQVANDYMKFLSDKIVKGEEVTLPSRLGTVAVIGRKRPLLYGEDGKPNLPPNWNATKKLWEKNPIAKKEKKIVYFVNEETSGVVYKVNWHKAGVAVTNKLLYSLRMTRKNKREISKEAKLGREFLIKTE